MEIKTETRGYNQTTNLRHESSKAIKTWFFERKGKHDIEPGIRSVVGIQHAYRSHTRKFIFEHNFAIHDNSFLRNVVAELVSGDLIVCGVLEGDLTDGLQFFRLTSLAQSNAAKRAKPHEGVDQRGNEGIQGNLPNGATT